MRQINEMKIRGMNLTIFYEIQIMLQLLPRMQRQKTDQKETTLTVGIVVVLLLMITFVGAGFYILFSAFYS